MFTQIHFPTIAALALLILSACADKPPLNSFCSWYVPNDFVDPALMKLNQTNKIAVIANETTRLRECAAAQSGLKAGPR